MGRFGTFAGLTLLMVFARYAPLDRAGDVIGWFVQRPAPAIVTGSVSIPAGSEPASADPSSRVAKAEDAVRIILAQASAQSEAQSGPGGGAAKASAAGRADGGDKPRSRVRNDAGPEELFIGGTGLLGDGEELPEKAVHPLAAANPNDYVVICEAGCRSQSDRIVFKVSKTAASAAAIAQRRLELTAASPEQVASAADAIVCVAGCYDDDEPVARHKRAEAKDEAPVAPVRLADVATKQMPADTQQMPAPQQVTAPQQDPAPSAAATITTASISPAPAPSPLEHAAAAPDAPRAVTDDLAAVHLISAETAAHAANRRAPSIKFATRLPARQEAPAMAAVVFAKPAISAWRTKVTSLVFKAAAPARVRSLVALEIQPAFETSISVEDGWQWTLVNTP